MKNYITKLVTEGKCTAEYIESFYTKNDVYAIYCISDELQKSINYDYDDLAKYIHDKELKKAIISIDTPNVVSKKNDRFELLWTIYSSIPLDKSLQKKLIDYIDGQCSDGWGESFEQSPYVIERDIDHYAHFWFSNGRKPTRIIEMKEANIFTKGKNMKNRRARYYGDYVAISVRLLGGKEPEKLIDITGMNEYEIKNKINDFIEKMSKKDGNEYEEWIITYGENIPDNFGENPDLSELGEYASIDDSERDMFKAYIEAGYDADIDDFHDAYYGKYDSEKEFVIQEFGSEIGHKLGDLELYFDYNSYTKDLFVNELWSAKAPDGDVYVFRTI